MLRYFGSVCGILLLSGCATLVNGTSETVTVMTDPPGASCKLERGAETIGAVTSTPGSVRVDKSSRDMSVTCTKSGFQTAAMSDDSHAVAATVGNLFAGGLIGLAVDAVSGADFSYVDEVRIALVVTPGSTRDVPDHAYCPAKGTQAGRTNSTAVVYQGPDPSNPDACLVAAGNDRNVSWYFSLVSADSTNADSARIALKSVLYGPPGTTASYTEGADAEQWTVNATMAAPEALVLNDRAILARKLVLHKRKADGSVEGDETTWLDPIDGMPLKRAWTQTTGSKTNGEDWSVITLRML